MMVIELKPVSEEETKPVPVSFFDEDDAALTPTAVSWSLYDELGAVVNDEEDIAISPAASVVIVVPAADHSASSTAARRSLVVEATYSTTYGTSLKMVQEFGYRVIPVTGKV